MTVKDFVIKYTPHANRVALAYGVPSLVTLAQAAWESGWAVHAPNYNFFGLTCSETYTGKKQLLTTTEYHKTKTVKYYEILSIVYQDSGKWKGYYKYRVKRWFRSFDNATQAFEVYALNLKNQGNYNAAFSYKKNPILFFDEVYKGGYATDPAYYTSVLSVMKMIKKYVS